MALFGIYGQMELAPLRGFAEGLARLGHGVAWRDHNFWSQDREKFDAIVILGLRLQGRDIAEHYTRLGIPIVVIDHGYMKRVHTLADYDTGYFQVGIGHLGWVPPEAPDGDRFKQLGVEIKSRAPRALRHALIAGQVAFDASHHMTESELAATYVRLGDAMRAAGLKVSYRGHPLARGVMPNLPAAPVSTLDEALEEADLLASVNSNAGLDALIAGVPACVLKPCHYIRMAYRWPTPLNMIQPPDPKKLTALLQRLAWAQWTVAEMREGLPQAFLASLGGIPK